MTIFLPSDWLPSVYYYPHSHMISLSNSQNISPLIVLTLVSPTQEISFHPQNRQPYLDSQMVVNLQISEKRKWWLTVWSTCEPWSSSCESFIFCRTLSTSTLLLMLCTWFLEILSEKRSIRSRYLKKRILIIFQADIENIDIFLDLWKGKKFYCWPLVGAFGKLNVFHSFQ